MKLSAEEKKILNHALQLITEEGWIALSFPKIAERAKVPLEKVYAAYPTPSSFIEAFTHLVDCDMLKNLEEFDANETVKDRLFAIFMTRFDVMAAYKPALQRLWQDALKDPCLVLYALPKAFNSMVWVYQAAGIPVSGVTGLLRVKALAVLYASFVWTWLKDESSDLAATMAAVDQGLTRLARLPGMIPEKEGRGV